MEATQTTTDGSIQAMIDESIGTAIDGANVIVDSLTQIEKTLSKQRYVDQSLTLALGNAVVQGIMEYAELLEKDESNRSKVLRDELIIKNLDPVIRDRKKHGGVVVPPKKDKKKG